MTRNGQTEVPDVVKLLEETLQRYADDLLARKVPVDVICDNLAAAGAAIGTRAAAMIRGIDTERDPMMALTTIMSHLEVTARNKGANMLNVETISRRVWNAMFPSSPKCMVCGRNGPRINASCFIPSASPSFLSPRTCPPG